jgi:PAS domain S-box-containing protein
VVDTMPLGVALFEADGRVTCNRHAEAMLGMSVSPAGGSVQYANRIRYPDGRPVPPGHLPSDRVKRGETVVSEQYVIEWPDGTRIPTLVSGAPIHDADGHVIGGVAAFQDLREHVRLTDVIDRSERLLRAVFDILPVGVWIADRTGRLLHQNPAGRRIWGGVRDVPMEQYDVYKGWRLATGERITSAAWGMARALTNGETSLGELIRIEGFDGEFRTIIHSSAPLRDEFGEIVGAIVVIEDVTALHEAQERARESERLLRTAFELLPVGVWVTDREGRITLANPAGDRIWRGTHLVGLSDYATYKGWWIETGQPIGAEEWGLWRAIHHGEESRSELIRIQCFDGSFKTIINWAAPILSGGGEIVGAVAINEDVTSLQHAQEQLRAAVADREEILAIVTHDLRAPIQTFLSGAASLELRAGELPGGEAVRALAAGLGEAAARMAGLVNDLLAVSVGEAGGPSLLKLEPISGERVLARAVDAAGKLLTDTSIQFEARQVAALPDLAVDADRILRVLTNLLENARKFTPTSGRITLAAEPTAGGVRFCVSNTGPPLNREELERMFQRFWQAERRVDGAGLGLSICRSIVEAHGGSIWAEPVAGERVRVCFELPRHGMAA